LAIDTCTFVADNFTEALELRPAPKARNAAHPQELCRHVPSPLKISKFAHNAALHFLARVKEYGLDESTRSDHSTSRKTAPVPGAFRE
jgi:hypothetical protein